MLAKVTVKKGKVLLEETRKRWSKKKNLYTRWYCNRYQKNSEYEKLD
jgi:hypothetical protein